MPKNLCLVPKIYVKMPFGQGLAQGGEEIRILIGQFVHFNLLKLVSLTRPSALGMSDPIWGPLIHIFVDEKKKCEG